MSETKLNEKALDVACDSTEQHIRTNGRVFPVNLRDVVEHAVTAYLAAVRQETVAETRQKIHAEAEWHIRTALARGQAKAKGSEIPEGLVAHQIDALTDSILKIIQETRNA